jgi:hypothetical protein
MPAFGLNQGEGLAGRERDALKKREAGTRARLTAKALEQPSGNAAEDNGPRGPPGFAFFPARLSLHGVSFLRLRLAFQSALKPLA